MDNYINFQRFLRENLKFIEDKIREEGVLSKKRLRSLISEFTNGKGKGGEITEDQINVLIRVLDVNGNDYTIKVSYLKYLYRK